MTSPAAEPSGLRGAQRPRILSVPPAVSSAAEEALDLVKMAGVALDPWQQFTLTESLGERADGKWAAFEVGVVVSRQNGKGGLLEARELTGLFLLGERLIIHSAHQFDTSLEAFSRLLNIIENCPELDARVQRVVRSHGEEGITLKGGQRIRFRTRTKGGGRGFTCDCLILDEAMIIPEAMHGALLPTLSARPNPQVWYTGSAVDEEVHQDGVVLARIRERGMAGNDPSLAYFEWSVDAELERIGPDVATDPQSWATANPALGIRISEEHVSHELASMAARTFAVERLGIGAWPSTDPDAARVIPLDLWTELTDPASVVRDPVAFAFDVTPDRSRSAIGVAGRRPDNKWHVEVIEHRQGTDWLPERLAELVKKHKPGGVFCDATGPAASLLPELKALNVDVTPVSAKEHGQACGMFYDAALQGNIRHLGQPELAAALDGAKKRPLGDAWAWSRKTSSVDISPLVAVTIAMWGSSSATTGVPGVWDLNEIVERLRRERGDGEGPRQEG